VSTAITILEYLWGSPQLQDAFIDYAQKTDAGMPSLHSMFSDLTASMTRNHYDWFQVTADEQGAQFRLIEHTRHEWDHIIQAMNQDIADRVSKTLLNGV